MFQLNTVNIPEMTFSTNVTIHLTRHVCINKKPQLDAMIGYNNVYKLSTTKNGKLNIICKRINPATKRQKTYKFTEAITDWTDLEIRIADDKPRLASFFWEPLRHDYMANDEKEKEKDNSHIKPKLCDGYIFDAKKLEWKKKSAKTK